MKEHYLTLEPPFLDFLNAPNGSISGLIGPIERMPRGITLGPVFITCPDGQTHKVDYIKSW